MTAKKNKIKAFAQWVKEHFRFGINPTTLPFPQADTSELLRLAKTHQLFVSKSDTISKATKPVILKKQVKREYWAPTSTIYVRVISGMDSVPLK